MCRFHGQIRQLRWVSDRVSWQGAGDCGPCATGWRCWAAEQIKRRQLCQNSVLFAIAELVTESQRFRTVLCSSNIGTCNVERRVANELAMEPTMREALADLNNLHLRHAGTVLPSWLRSSYADRIRSRSHKVTNFVLTDHMGSVSAL